VAIRVTQVILQVLHQGKIAQENVICNGEYLHDYTSFDGAVDSQNSIETAGSGESGLVLSGHYDLAGFTEVESTPGAGYYDLNAYVEEEGVPFSGHYTLTVLLPNDGSLTAAYDLNAFLVLDDQRYGNYDLNAYAAKTISVTSEYELQIYLLAQGLLQGVYDVNVFVDLLMHAVVSYDLNIYEQNDNVIGQGNYDLNAWEAREAALGAHYALITFAQATGYLDAESAVEVLEALNQRFGVHYDLAALETLQQFSNHSYNIEVLKLAELGIGAHWQLLVYQALNGFADATSVMNAFEAADGFADAQYGLDIYLARTGFVDGLYQLQSLLAATGYVDGTYLLDTTQELFTWVINHNTGAPSRYENYDFDAFAKLGENYLAARPDGIFLLDGDDDDGAAIDAIATIGRTDFDEPVLKRVIAAYLGLTSAGQAHITLRTDQGIENGPYKLRQQPAASTTERAKFKRGIKSRYWEFDIENVDGEDLQIKSAEFETLVLGEKRRLKK